MALRRQNTYTGAARAQLLRVFVIPATTAGVYLFTVDQNCIVDSVVLNSVGAADSERVLEVQINGAQPTASIYLAPGGTTTSDSPELILSPGDSVRVKVRGYIGTEVYGSVHADGDMPTTYRLAPSQPATGVWRMVGGVWTPVRETYRKHSGAWEEADVYRDTGVWTLIDEA